MAEVFEITITPHGKVFEAAAGETVLAGALGAGLNFPYGCNNGTCGLCAARVVAGTVTQVVHQDFVFDGVRKRAGYALMCCSSAASDVAIEIGEARSARDLPHVQLMVKLMRVTTVAPEVLEVKLRCPRATVMRYLSGQYVVLTLGDVSASVPIASCPCEGGEISVHVDAKLRPRLAGALSAAPRAARVQIAGPEGEFCLHESTTLECPAVLMIAEDIGIASVQGLLGQLVNVDYAGPVRVFWHARAGMNRYAANACRALADALDDGVFTFIEAPIDPSTAINAFGSGRDIAVYLAASADAIKVDIAGVRALGVCAQRIFSSANDEGISV